MNGPMPADATTWKENNEAWLKIADKFNAVSGNFHRTAKTVKAKYETIKKNLRKTCAKMTHGTKKTGGGVPDCPTLTPYEEKILSISQITMLGMSSRFDNDIVSEYNEELVQLESIDSNEDINFIINPTNAETQSRMTEEHCEQGQTEYNDTETEEQILVVYESDANNNTNTQQDCTPQKSSYEMALQEEKQAVASSKSEQETIKRADGKRIIKPKRYNSFTPPPVLEDSFSSNSVGAASHNIDEESAEANDSEFSTGGEITTKVDELYIYENNPLGEDTLTQDEIPIVLTNDNFAILTNHILEIKGMVRLILNKVNQSTQDNSEENVLADHKIIHLLPLISIEDFLTMEELLKDMEATRQLFNKMSLIGGTNLKHFIRRCLAVLFSNNLASICSWTGQKQNFKVDDTEVIKINSYLSTLKPMSLIDYQNSCKEVLSSDEYINI